eukprot:scaffold19435_cov73-Skeletonema_marinoi.AAC.4
MFSTKQQQQSSEPASKNVSAWESLILDLESHGDDDDDDEEGGWFLNGGASSSLQLSARSGNGEEKMEQESEDRLPQLLTNIHRDSSAAAANASNDRGEQQTSPILESPSQLKDWMAYQSTNTKYAPHSNHMGRKMDAAYSLKAAEIALSLAKYLGRQFEQDDIGEESRHEDLQYVHYEDVIVDNVIVKTEDSGEVVSAVLESTSSTSGATTHRSGGNKERRQVLALGIIMYELFTQGNPPPKWIQQSLKSSASASALSFVTSLRISEQSEEDDDRGASGGDRRKNKDDDDDNDMDESDQQELFVRKQRLRRCDEEKGKEQSVS